MQRSPFYPYPPRPGAEIAPLEFESAKAPAGLSQEAIEGIEVFEHQLFGLELDAEHYPTTNAYLQKQAEAGSPVVPIEKVWLAKINVTYLGVAYFTTNVGREALQTTTGIKIEADDTDEVATTLASLDVSAIDSKILGLLESESIGYEEDRLTKIFIENGYNGDTVPDFYAINVHKNPAVLADKARGYTRLKAYLRQVRADLHAQSSDSSPEELEAKLLLTDLYRGRVNELLAETYVDAYKLLAQHQLSGGSHADVIAELEAILPAFRNRSNREANARTLQRMDRFKRGVVRGEDGRYTWLSREASDLAATAGTDTSVTPVERGIYADIDPAWLSTTKITGQVMEEWTKDVLEDYSLLSAHSEWDEEREGPAPDGKWQVILNKKFKSLSVFGKQRAVRLADKGTTVKSALVRINHEVVHVLQNENRRNIGHLALIANVGFEEVSEQTESGGIWKEDEATGQLMGVATKEISGIGYMRATRAKEAGASFGEIVQIYHEQLLIDNPNTKPEAAAAQAVNRTRRIFRAGGFEYAQGTKLVTNSQPVNYLEQGLVYSSLDETRRRLLFVGGISIANFELLSNYGLVDADKIHMPDQMPIEVLYPKVKALYDSSRATA